MISVKESIAEKHSVAASRYAKYTNVSAKYQNLKTPHNTPVTSPAEERSSPLPSPRKAIIPLGDVTVKGTNMRLSIFGFSLRDPNWVYFNMESYQITLNQKRKNEKETHRQLSIVFGKNYISKMVRMCNN
jgi:hypothetical protein